MALRASASDRGRPPGFGWFEDRKREEDEEGAGSEEAAAEEGEDDDNESGPLCDTSAASRPSWGGPGAPARHDKNQEAAQGEGRCAKRRRRRREASNQRTMKSDRIRSRLSRRGAPSMRCATSKLALGLLLLLLMLLQQACGGSSAQEATQEAGEQAAAAAAAAGLGDEHTSEFKSFLTLIYLVIFVIGVAGNICNCLVIADSRNRYMKTATNYYLFSLSVSDLLLLTFGLPHDIVNLWHPSPYLFNSFVCISRGWISEASTYASVLVIVAFTFERYLAICHPLRAHTLSRLSRAIKIIVAIWLVASTCALVVVWQFGIQTTMVEITTTITGNNLLNNNNNNGDQRNSSSNNFTTTTTAAAAANAVTTAASDVQHAARLNAIGANSSAPTDGGARELHSAINNWPPNGSLQEPSKLILIENIGSSSSGSGNNAAGQLIQVKSTKAIAQCTTVALNEKIFELSVLIFFIIPMTVITILYMKLGYHLRQKTFLIKQNRLMRERNLSERCHQNGDATTRLFLGPPSSGTNLDNVSRSNFITNDNSHHNGNGSANDCSSSISHSSLMAPTAIITTETGDRHAKRNINNRNHRGPPEASVFSSDDLMSDTNTVVRYDAALKSAGGGGGAKLGGPTQIQIKVFDEQQQQQQRERPELGQCAAPSKWPMNQVNTTLALCCSNQQQQQQQQQGRPEVGPLEGLSATAPNRALGSSEQRDKNNLHVDASGGRKRGRKLAAQAGGGGSCQSLASGGGNYEAGQSAAAAAEKRLDEKSATPANGLHGTRELGARAPELLERVIYGASGAANNRATQQQADACCLPIGARQMETTAPRQEASGCALAKQSDRYTRPAAAASNGAISMTNDCDMGEGARSRNSLARAPTTTTTSDDEELSRGVGSNNNNNNSARARAGREGCLGGAGAQLDIELIGGVLADDAGRPRAPAAAATGRPEARAQVAPLDSAREPGQQARVSSSNQRESRAAAAAVPPAIRCGAFQLDASTAATAAPAQTGEDCAISRDEMASATPGARKAGSASDLTAAAAGWRPANRINLKNDSSRAQGGGDDGLRTVSLARDNCENSGKICNGAAAEQLGANRLRDADLVARPRSAPLAPAASTGRLYALAAADERREELRRKSSLELNYQKPSQPQHHHQAAPATPAAPPSQAGRRGNAPRKKKQPQQQSANFALNSTVNASSMKSVIKMLVSVVVMFFICWAPFHAQRLMAIYVREPTSEQVFVFNLLNHISGVSYYISAVANPILYSLYSMRFRQAFRDTFGSMSSLVCLASATSATAGAAASAPRRKG